MFVNYIIKCITRRYMFLHVYIQFSLALYKTETQFIHFCVQSERGKHRESGKRELESGERDFWERGD